MVGAKGRRDSLLQVGRRQEPHWLDALVLATRPLGLDRVEPRAFGRRLALDDPHPGAAGLDLSADLGGERRSRLRDRIAPGVQDQSLPAHLEGPNPERHVTATNELCNRAAGLAGSNPTQLAPLPIIHASDVPARAFGLKRKLRARLPHQGQADIGSRQLPPFGGVVFLQLRPRGLAIVAGVSALAPLHFRKMCQGRED